MRGLLLAAGAGRRMGGPKALLRDDSGETFAARGVNVLHQGGCASVTVVVGAAASQVRAAVEGPGVDVVVAPDWDTGMGASLRAGLRAVESDGAVDAVVVLLVDLPDVGPTVVRRLLESVPAEPTALARTSYDGRPGHPVLIGREHWAGVARSAEGDRGAREYFGSHAHTVLECGDLATGHDTDTPDRFG